MEILENRVRNAVEIGAGVQRHAAHQAMTFYLDDWEKAYARLGRAIERLRSLRDERLAAAEAGTWPPPLAPTVDRSGDSDFECALTFAPLFYDTPEGL